MNLEFDKIEYNKLIDAYLTEVDSAEIHSIILSTYIVNEKELMFAKNIFDIIFTSEIANPALLENKRLEKKQIASIAFPSKLVSFIKRFKSIKHKKNYLDQFLLNALLCVFDENDGHYGLRDFFELNPDVLKLKDLFFKHKADIIDYLYVRNIFTIISNIEFYEDKFCIYDIDEFVETSAKSVSFIRHIESDPFIRYECSLSEQEYIKKSLVFYFEDTEDEIVGKQSDLVAFIEKLLNRRISDNLLECIKVISMQEDNFQKHFLEKKIDDLSFYLNFEKNSLFKKISGYDINPLFLIHGNARNQFDFNIPVQFNDCPRCKPMYRWEMPIDLSRDIVVEIQEFSTLSSHEIGRLYEKHVAEFLIDNRGYALIEHSGGSGDGGVDLLMSDTDGKRIAVQCKYSLKRSIGKKALNEIFTGKALRGADCGLLCSNTAFSTQCQNEALQLGIKLERVVFKE